MNNQFIEKKMEYYEMNFGWLKNDDFIEVADFLRQALLEQQTAILKELLEEIENKTKLKEVGKSEKGKSIMQPGKQTIFDLSEIKTIINNKIK